MNFKHYKRLIAISCVSLLLGVWVFGSYQSTHGQQPTSAQTRNPKAWGSNHVGKPVPEFVSSDECLFCHRNTIGPHWQENAHGVTIRPVEDAPKLQELLKQPELSAVAKEINYVLGSRHHIRFLKKQGYGKFALLNTRVVLDDSGKVLSWIDKDQPQWNQEKFGNSCAGCHATAVDVKTKTFTTFGLDCYTCHGEVNLQHTNDTKLMILSKQRRKEPELITSICAQCHLRESRSQSTGLPYPNNFVAGDNLFQDLTVDFAKADDEKLNPIERHIYRNVRDVVVEGKTAATCITCHQVHFESRTLSMARHQALPRGPMCFDCHVNQSSFKAVKPFTMSSRVCEY